MCVAVSYLDSQREEKAADRKHFKQKHLCLNLFFSFFSVKKIFFCVLLSGSQTERERETDRDRDKGMREYKADREDTHHTSKSNKTQNLFFSFFLSFQENLFCVCCQALPRFSERERERERESLINIYIDIH